MGSTEQSPYSGPRTTDAEEPDEGATVAIPDCPVDVPNTTVAVLAEAQGIAMVFRLGDPSDTVALDALRLRVRALADRYRQERLAEYDGLKGATTARSVAKRSVDFSAATANARTAEGSRRVDGASGRTIAASGELMVTVEDTSDGAMIVITAKDPAELDLLRVRLTQDAQVMTQSGACPW